MPSKSLSSLVVKLEANSAQLRKELRLVEGRVGQSSKRMHGSFRKVSASASQLRGVLSKVQLGVASLAGAAGIVAVVKGALDLADGVDKASQKLGVTTDFLQEARFAADQSGVALNTLEMAMQRFTRRAAEAAKGTGEARGAIEELGISLRGSNGTLRTSEALFRDALAALSQVDAPAEKLRLAFKLFDSEGAVLVNMADNFEKLAGEAKAAGQVLGKDTIAQSVKAKDELSKLSNEIQLTLIPALADLSDPILDVTKLLAGLAISAGGTYDLMRDFFNLDPRGLQDIRDRIGEINEQLNDTAERSEPGIAKLFGFIDKLRGKKFGSDLSLADVKALEEERAQLLKREALYETIEANRKRRAEAVAQVNTETVDAGEVERRERGLELLRRAVEEEQRLAAAKAIGDQALRETAIAIETENQARQLGIDLKSQEGEELRRLIAEHAALKETIEPVGKEHKTMTDQMNQNMQAWSERSSAAFADFVQTGKFSFKRLAMSFQHDLIRQLAQKFIFGALFGAPGLATGGPAKAGRPYIVGEEGPELFVPKSSGTVIPNNRLSAMAPEVVQIPSVRVPTMQSGGPVGGGGGGDTSVVINNYTEAEATAQERETGNGNRVIEVTIRKEVDRGLASGAHDRALQTRFGMRPVGRPGA